MKFINAKVASFEVFFSGPATLMFDESTSDARIREYIDQKYYGGNWGSNTLSIRLAKVKESDYAPVRMPA